MKSKPLRWLLMLAVVVFLPRLIAKLRERPMLEVSELEQRLDGTSCDAGMTYRPAL